MVRNLEDVRADIDCIDDEIIKLIAKRQSLVIMASEFKKNEDGVKAPKRVNEVIKKVRISAQEYGANPDIVEKVYRTMIEGFVNMEMKEFKKNKISETEDEPC